MTFPDASRPIATCSETDCEGCQVASHIHCHFRRPDLLHFLLASIPGLLVAGAGLLFLGVWPLVAWVVIVIGFFGFLEIRVKCSHCPHYAEEGRTLGCWANHGAACGPVSHLPQGNLTLQVLSDVDTQLMRTIRKYPLRRKQPAVAPVGSLRPQPSADVA
jgi:hypothetical protein